MRAPGIYVIVGVNRDSGDPIGWSFCEREAEARAEEINKAAGEYACRVELCAPIGETPIGLDWRR